MRKPNSGAGWWLAATKSFGIAPSWREVGQTLRALDLLERRKVQQRKRHFGVRGRDDVL
jgi:hypothetical protein